MGRERASTTRRRERGDICCSCRRILPPVGERYCAHCEPRHRVYVHFQLRVEGWVCNFLEMDYRTSASPIRTMREATLRAMIEKGGGITDSESREMLEFAIQKGRGGVVLSLTEEQYRAISRES